MATTKKNTTTSTALTVAPAPTATTTAVAIPVEKALNSTQTKALEKIVTADFASMLEAIELEINRRVDAKKDMIERTKQGKFTLAEAQQKIVEAAAKASAIMSKASDEIVAAGFVVGAGRYNAWSVDTNTDYITLAGVQDAQNRVAQAGYRLVRHARTILAREERAVQRNILLNTITSSAAADILNNLPTAEKILAVVTAEMGDSVEEFMAELS